MVDVLKIKGYMLSFFLKLDAKMLILNGLRASGVDAIH
jgi:hypothetical protein